MTFQILQHFAENLLSNSRLFKCHLPARDKEICFCRAAWSCLLGNKQSDFFQTRGPSGRVCRKEKSLVIQAGGFRVRLPSPAVFHTLLKSGSWASGLPERLCRRQAPSSSQVHFVARNRTVVGDLLPASRGLHLCPFRGKVGFEGQGQGQWVSDPTADVC